MQMVAPVARTAGIGAHGNSTSQTPEAAYGAALRTQWIQTG